LIRRVKLVNDWSILEKSMAKVSAFEAKTHFGKLLDRVVKGEEIVITRHDKPVARLVPEGAQRVDEVRQAVAGLLELQQQIRRRSKAKLSDADVRAAIEEGRQ
jgi:prevent-host-death family protein